MAGVLEVLASYIQNMMTEMVTEEVRMLLGVSSEIDKMSMKLNDLRNFLTDADRKNITDHSVQSWVRELRDAMYDATNILDLCQLKGMERDPRDDEGCFNAMHFCMRNPLHAHDISNRIKKLNQKLDEIKKRSMDFSFINLNSYEDHNRRAAYSRPCGRETSAELDESSLVGEKIKEDTRSLVEMLTKEEVKNRKDKKISVFAIVGVGGIGKTTLAQKIFNHEAIQQEFEKKIWLSVTDDYNNTELLKRAITEAGGDHRSVGDTKGALERTLKEALNGSKTILVMDDVWNHQAWEGVLKIPLVNVLGQGSCVLVTTRNDMVAQRMMAEVPYHHVNKIKPEDAWSLLKKQVAGNGDKEPQICILKDIGMKIIEKCDGLPLAVKVLGGLLCQKKITQSNWENVLNDFIWSESQMPQELNYAIYLSYQDLHPWLKPCFLYYALLPKSKLFYADEVIGMWISEGLIHGNSCHLEELGRQYYEELIWRNLIEPDKKYIDQQVCNIHDVVRSFAQHVARNEALLACRTDAGIFGQLNSQRFIWISLETTASESNELAWSSLQSQTLLRTLISVSLINFKASDSLHYFPSLRTLHLESTNIDAIAESLFRLKHLRYLSVKHTDISRLPESIGKMKFLQYISLFGCKRLVKLPDSIGKLQQLRVLNLSGTNIKQIPRGFGVLINLRKLYGFPAQMDGAWCSLEELGPLSNLTELHVKGLENVSSSSFASKAKLSEKMQLSYLRLGSSTHRDDNIVVEEEQQLIEEVFDELCPPPFIENLPIINYFGRRLPRWMMSTGIGHLRNLRILTMIGLPYCTKLPDGLCQLPCLEFLEIDRAPLIRYVGPKLVQPEHHENLRHLEHLGSIVELELFESLELERICNLRKLQRLCVSMCPKLQVLEGMPALQSFMLEDYDMKTLPEYLQAINVRHLQIHCDLSLLTSIGKGISSPEWYKLKHIQHVIAYANDDNNHIPRKWYVSYTRDPIRFETNISPAATAAYVSGDGDGEQGALVLTVNSGSHQLASTNVIHMLIIVVSSSGTWKMRLYNICRQFLQVDCHSSFGARVASTVPAHPWSRRLSTLPPRSRCLRGFPSA